MKKPLNVLVMASGQGTTFNYLCEHQASADFRIVGLIVSSENAGAVLWAKKHEIPYKSLGQEQLKSSAGRKDFFEKVLSFQPDLIVLAGFLKKIPSELIQKFSKKIINSHPALLPKYGGKGMYGRHVHEAVIKNGEKYSGATIHEVTEEFDEGPILLQESFLLSPQETVESLEEKVKAIEKPLLIKAIQRWPFGDTL